MKSETIYLGVPCSATGKNSLMPCTREDEAIAVAVGFYLCGIKNTEVFMQNSGYGHCLDIITSLLMPYGIDIEICVYRGSETSQHEYMNLIQKDLMNATLRGHKKHHGVNKARRNRNSV
jgi:sulfopyruvate decarboxylase TPP-binding subunit